MTSKPREGSEPGRRGSAPRSRKVPATRLEEELRRLQALGLGVALSRVVWSPGARTDIEAEVADGAIRVYVAEPEAAINAVRHEVLDYEISMCCRPYAELVNAMLAVANKDAYRIKEKLAETLRRALGPRL